MQSIRLRRRRARTLWLPKPPALYLTSLHSMPLLRANTPTTQIPSRHQVHTHHQCTRHTVNLLHPPHRSSPLRRTLSMGPHSHLHPLNLLAHRLFPPHLPHSRLRHRPNSALKVAGHTNPDHDRRRRPRPTRTPFPHTPTDKYAHNPLVHRTPGFASVT